TDGLAAGDGMDGELVSGGNVRRYGEAQTIERLACGERLEGDHNVVRISEFESPVAQSALKSPVVAGANCRKGFIGTTTLYSNCRIKDSGSPPARRVLRKVFYYIGIALD